MIPGCIHYGARPSSACRRLVVIFLLLGNIASSAEPGMAPRSLRESAVQQARKGDSRGALHKLQDLVRQFPDDSDLLADTTIIANWAGDDSYALEIYARKQTPKDNPSVIEAAARSARNLHRYDLALDLFRRAEIFSPNRWQPRLGHAMVLVDKARYGDAEEVMKPLLKDFEAEPDVERGEAYLCFQERDFPCAIAMYQHLLNQSPKDTAGLNCQISEALAQLGGDTIAQEICEIPDASEKLWLQAATGAEMVRWADSIDQNWDQRRTEGAQALLMLNAVIAATRPGTALWRQAQSDRLLALAELYRMREVVGAWEHLREMGIEVPDYAVVKVANAYLALHRPKQAEELYRGLVRRSPADGNAWSGLAYTEFEREHISEAIQTINRAYENSPAWLRSPGLKVPQPNLIHTRLGMQAAQMQGNAEMLSEEQRRLSELLATAPANPDLGRAIAMTYLARGWPLLAIREERMADSFEQKSDLPVLEDAEVLEGAGRREEVDAVLRSVLNREGSSPTVTRFMNDLAIERGWELSVQSEHEWSGGQYLGNSQHSEFELNSPLINDRLRIFAQALGDSGNFAAGSAYRSRTAVGLRYDYRRQSIWGEAAADTGNSPARAAGEAGARLSVGDHWTIGVDGDSDNLKDVQLIAQISGVRARSGKLDIEFRQSELSSLILSVQRFLYTDGNQRSALFGSWSQRIITAPRLQVSILPQLWTSTNSLDQSRIYFNPKRDFAAGVGSQVDWVSWRHYTHSLRQQFALYIGPYWEKSYGINGSGSAGYTPQWQLTDRLRVFGKVVWHEQPYDGVQQPYTDLSFGLTWGNQ